MEASSIGGLPYINSTAGFARGYWILALLVCSALSAYLTYEAAKVWQEHPVETTIETFKISEVQFPNIVVCPPKVLFSLHLLSSTDLYS